MQRLSEVVLGLLTLSEEVVMSIETHGKEIAAKLLELWATLDQGLDGEAAPDVEGNLTALHSSLAASGRQTSEADQRHVKQLAVTMDLREQIQKVTGRVYKKLSKIRRVMDELHGEGKAFLLAGIEGPTAQSPRKLLRQCELALQRLLDPELVLPVHELDGIEVDPMKLALGLKVDVERLLGLLVRQRQARRVLQKTRKEKNRAIDAHRRILVWTARAAESYYMLAGEVELAERLRPATRRRGRPSSPGSSQPTEPEEPSAEPSAEAQTPEGRTPTVQPPEDPTEPQPSEGSGSVSVSTEA